jgi:hypothetical protein
MTRVGSQRHRKKKLNAKYFLFESTHHKQRVNKKQKIPSAPQYETKR